MRKMNSFYDFICGVVFGLSLIWTIVSMELCKRFFPEWSILDEYSTNKMLVYVAFVLIGLFLMTLSFGVYKELLKIESKRV